MYNVDQSEQKYKIANDSSDVGYDIDQIDEGRYSVQQPGLVGLNCIVNYTTTQMTFVFKLPSTKSIIFNDGDGNKTTIPGQDGTKVTHQTTYTTQKQYNVQITGDYNNITYLFINIQPHVSGNIQFFPPPTDCIQFIIPGCSFYGNIDNLNWNPSITVFRVNDNGGQNKGAGLTGNVTNLPFIEGLLIFRISNNSFTGSVTNWEFQHEDISVVECSYNNLTGLLPIIEAMATRGLSYKFDHNSISGYSITTFRPAMSVFDIHNLDAAFASVDDLLEDIADYYQTNAPLNDCLFDLRGPNLGIPTDGASNADVARIETYYTNAGHAATVRINESDPTFDNGKLVITFDGDHETIYSIGYDILTDEGEVATMYSWIDDIGEINAYDWAEMTEMDTGGMDMQGHSETHTAIRDLTDGELEDELIAVDNAFVANSLSAPDHVAYPFGRNDDRTDAVVDDYRLSGRKFTVTNPDPIEYKNLLKYSIQCYLIEDLSSDVTFDLDELKSVMLKAQTNNGALIVISHELSETGADGNTSRADFIAIIDYANEIGMDIITMSQLYPLLT